MRHLYKASALFLFMLLPVAAAQAQTAPLAKEAYCDPVVLQELIKTYQVKQNDMDESYGGLLKKVKDGATGAVGDISKCIDMSWPTLSITYPTMDMIIRGIAKVVVNKVCSEQQEAMSKLNGTIYGSYYMNTRLPGVPSVGIQTYGSPTPPGSP